jgi:ribonuclease HII
MSAKFDLELLPPAPTLRFEQALWEKGLSLVAGIDEAGRGPIAGPVSAAAIILPVDPGLTERLKGVRDSKQMPAEAREHWAETLKQVAVAYGVGYASVEEIDYIGIAPATQLAAQRALDGLAMRPDHLLLDYFKLPGYQTGQTSLIKGDARSLSIAAASVLAKTARDALLIDMDCVYPGYGFASHKGYCTRAHIEALERLGPCDLHRRSFRPLFRETGA